MKPEWQQWNQSRATQMDEAGMCRALREHPGAAACQARRTERPQGRCVRRRGVLLGRTLLSEGKVVFVEKNVT